MATNSPVRLAVYDISQGMARQFGPMLGVNLDYIPHTGVLVFGSEFFFGGGIQEARHEEVVRSYGMRPIASPEVLGMTTKTRSEFLLFLSSVREQFTQHTYDLLGNNCNHFSDACVKFLLGGVGIPTEIVTLPNVVLRSPLGQMLRPMLDNLQAQMQQQFTQHQVSTAPPLPPPSLVSSLTGLQTLPPREHLEALTTLHRVIKNITSFPHEAKYLKLALGNAKFQSSLGRHEPHGVGCLLGLGFTRQPPEMLVLAPTQEQWPKLVMGEKVVAMARKKAIEAMCAGVATREQALVEVFAMPAGREDAFVLDVVDAVFHREQ
ncbi:hypothetical protein BASA81_012807 [Batrachochytrium salamandrivorans]|nr:hypothetical protein BASA81_012807 [Batrachochytrium salamandrivorans]